MLCSWPSTIHMQVSVASCWGISLDKQEHDVGTLAPPVLSEICLKPFLDTKPEASHIPQMMAKPPLALIPFHSYSYPHRLFHPMHNALYFLITACLIHAPQSIDSDLPFCSCKPAGYMLFLELFDTVLMKSTKIHSPRTPMNRITISNYNNHGVSWANGSWTNGSRRICLRVRVRIKHV